MLRNLDAESNPVIEHFLAAGAKIRPINDPTEGSCVIDFSSLSDKRNLILRTKGKSPMTVKSLLFSALLFSFSAGVARSQVDPGTPGYEVNAVGYLNVTLHSGFNLVANALVAEDNSIGAVFKNIQNGVPGGMTIYRLIGGQFVTATWDDLDNKFVPDDVSAQQLLPGDGVFLYLPGDTDRVLTEVGEIQQGTVCTDLPHGFSVKSNPIAQAGSVANWNFPATDGDLIYVWNNVTHTYQVFQYDILSESWLPDLPTLSPGQAFLVYHQGLSTQWCRTFFINIPG